jgi:hypothetical protein
MPHFNEETDRKLMNITLPLNVFGQAFHGNGVFEERVSVIIR